MLENRLDKAMIKSNEAQSIRKTYQQIVKRLQQDRLKVPRHSPGPISPLAPEFLLWASEER